MTINSRATLSPSLAASLRVAGRNAGPEFFIYWALLWLVLYMGSDRDAFAAIVIL